jgi:putative NADH-flavin reductase
MRRPNMKVTVLGAAGRTGRLIVEQALARGDEVVAYLRDAHGMAATPGLSVVCGQLADSLTLKSAISGTDAVLVCLGTHKKKPIDLMQKSLPLIIQAMTGANVLRLVLLSAYGVGATSHTAGFFARIVYRTIVRSVYRDKENSEALLPGSGLSWTCVYPVGLADGPPAGVIEVRPMTQVRKVYGLPRVSRADVARVMLDAARDDRTIGETLLVSSECSVL